MTCQTKTKVQQAKHKGRLAEGPGTTHKTKTSYVSQHISHLTTPFSRLGLLSGPRSRVQEATNTRVCGIAIIFVAFGTSDTHTSPEPAIQQAAEIEKTTMQHTLVSSMLEEVA